MSKQTTDEFMEQVRKNVDEMDVETKKREELEARAIKSFTSTYDDLVILFAEYMNGIEENEELGTFNEYGLSLDWVESGTFDDQLEGYLRYQFSWGGPSSEIRYFVDWKGDLHRIEFWFLDWGCGHEIAISPRDPEWDLLSDIFEHFKECGVLPNVE